MTALEVRVAALAPLLLFAVALALRAAQFGNPVQDFDEQLYLLVGERMLDGATLYVDLWDRKPPGLFALFALFAATRHGLIVSQIAATICAAATAWIGMRIAMRAVPLVPALLGATCYLVFLVPLGGGSTQAPVFYNLPVALAAWLVLRFADAPRARESLWQALTAMLLCGVAIQIKPTAVLVGIWFGLFLLWRDRQAGASLGSLASRATLYMLAGLVPSLAAAAAFVATGHFDAFWFANVESIFLRQSAFDALAWATLGSVLLAGAPMLALGALGFAAAWRNADRDLPFLAGWAAFAAIEFAALGCFWPHALLPLLLVLAILASRLLAATGLALPVFVGATLFAAWAAIVTDAASAAAQRDAAARVVAAIPPEVGRECLFVYEGHIAYYRLARACTVTPFVFSYHLVSPRERDALGTDPVVAVAAALARRPLAILTLRTPPAARSLAQDRLVADALVRGYRLQAELPANPGAPDAVQQIWVRRDAVAPSPPSTGS